MFKLELGYKYRVRGVNEAKYAEVVEKIDNPLYPFLVKIVYSEHHSEFGVYTETGRYDTDFVSRFDLVEMIGGSLDEGCHHEYESVLLFNTFREYCKKCGIKK